MDEASNGTIKQAFCYLRTQYPERKTDYVEEIKYDSGHELPLEVVDQLREVHKAIAVKEVVGDCAVCFYIQVEGECYVCACRARTVKPMGERQYLMLKAFVVTDSDLKGASSLAIGTASDWESMEQLKVPIMPVNLRTLDTSRSGQYKPMIDYCIKVFERKAEGTVSWPPYAEYPDIMTSVRLALQKLPVEKRGRKNIAIGLPHEVNLPLQLDLWVGKAPASRTSTQSPAPPKTPHPMWGLEDDLIALGTVIENLKVKSGSQEALWVSRLWNTIQDMITDVNLYKKKHPSASARKRTVRRIRERLDSLQMEYRRAGFGQELDAFLNGLEADMNNLHQPVRSESQPYSYQEVWMRFNSRRAKAWGFLGVLLCLGAFIGILRSPWMAGQSGAAATHPPRSTGANNDPRGGNSTGSNSTSDPQPPLPEDPLDSLLGKYSFTALTNLFPEEMDPEEAKSIQGLYAEMNRRQTGMPDNLERHNIRVEAYNTIARTLTGDQQDWLLGLKPVLARMALSPQQWARLGPHDRLNQGQWDSIKELQNQSPPLSDQEFKKQVGTKLSPAQLQIVGPNYR